MTIQQEIIDLLNELRWTKGSDLSILFICHDIALVQQFCEYVLVMYKGDIVEQGAHDELIAQGGEYALLWGRPTGAYLE